MGCTCQYFATQRSMQLFSPTFRSASLYLYFAKNQFFIYRKNQINRQFSTSLPTNYPHRNMIAFSTSYCLLQSGWVNGTSKRVIIRRVAMHFMCTALMILIRAKLEKTPNFSSTNLANLLSLLITTKKMQHAPC